MQPSGASSTCALGVSEIHLSRLPAGRLKAFARTAASAWAPVIARMPTERRVATLLAFAKTYELVAQDDAPDLFDQLVQGLLARAVQRSPQRRLRQLHDLDLAAVQMSDVCRILMDPQYRDEDVRAAYREGQEDQLGALGLVLNMVVLWNTRYMDVALKQLQANSTEVCGEDVACLTPRVFKHINFLGRHHFSQDEHLVRGELRPLRDPANASDLLL